MTSTTCHLKVIQFMCCVVFHLAAHVFHIYLFFPHLILWLKAAKLETMTRGICLSQASEKYKNKKGVGRTKAGNQKLERTLARVRKTDYRKVNRQTAMSKRGTNSSMPTSTGRQQKEKWLNASRYKLGLIVNEEQLGKQVIGSGEKNAQRRSRTKYSKTKKNTRVSYPFTTFSWYYHMIKRRLC